MRTFPLAYYASGALSMPMSKLCHFAAQLCVALFLSVKMGRGLVSPTLGWGYSSPPTTYSSSSSQLEKFWVAYTISSM